MPSPPCVIIDSPAATVWSDPAVSESLRTGIAADPSKLIRAAASWPVKISHECLIVQEQWPIGDRSMGVAIKQYRPRTFWKALAAIVRPAKAMQNWRKAAFLLSHEIATPRPLFACRGRGWTTSSTSFLVTQWISGAENLHLFGWRIAAQPLAERLRRAAQCAAALGRLLGKMHAAGAAHRNLKAANLLVVEEGRDVIAYLVDLDGLQAGKPLAFQRQARDLARLAAGLAAHPWVTRSICRRFLRAYLGAFPAAGRDWKPLWRAIVVETAGLRRRKQKRGQQVL